MMIDGSFETEAAITCIASQRIWFQEEGLVEGSTITAKALIFAIASGAEQSYYSEHYLLCIAKGLFYVIRAKVGMAACLVLPYFSTPS